MEISSIEYNNGANRLALESIDESETEYRFAWRGNERTKDGFVNNPAWFEWEQLGQLIRKGFDSGKIKDSDIKAFLFSLYNLDQQK